MMATQRDWRVIPIEKTQRVPPLLASIVAGVACDFWNAPVWVWWVVGSFVALGWVGWVLRTAFEVKTAPRWEE